MAEVKEELDKYVNGWTDTMLEMWREQVERLKIVNTGRFHQSFRSQIASVGEGTTIRMTFMRYGIYQALGTGRGYSHDNGGDLEFLDESYREKHRLNKPRRVGPKWGGYMTSGKPRQRRDWINKKYYRSVMVLREELARLTGETAASIISEALSNVRSTLS